jgi:hypothetical protein
MAVAVKLKYLWIGLGALVLLALLFSFWFLAVLILAIGAIGLGVIAIATGSAPYLKSKRAGAIAAGIGALALVIGGAGAVSALPSPVNTSQAAPATQSTEPIASAKPTATPKATPTTKPKPVQEIKQVEERSVVPFTSSTVDDANLASGTTAVVTAGANGERVVTYRVTYEDGVEVSREVATDVISVAPINEVIANGTYVAPPPPPPAPANDGCHPSYEGACVPIADDVDCAGGSGNGPAYVQGPIRVIGPDVYDLERDGDGIACDV